MALDSSVHVEQQFLGLILVCSGVYQDVSNTNFCVVPVFAASDQTRDDLCHTTLLAFMGVCHKTLQVWL